MNIPVGKPMKTTGQVDVKGVKGVFKQQAFTPLDSSQSHYSEPKHQYNIHNILHILLGLRFQSVALEGVL
jgi:hypothetical protein